jgi:hypothetical protein
MSKATKLPINTDSKNGVVNIKASRDAANLQNLEQDRKIWKQLSKLEDSDIVDGRIKILTGYTKKGDPKYKIDKDADAIFVKMKKQIFRMNSIHFGVSSESEIELWMIKEKINAILNADDNLIQCDYCRNSTRQSIDELVQIATLEKYVSDAVVRKPVNGTLTLKDSKIIQKPKTKKANKDPRSIDIVIEKNGVSYYVFAKYAGPVGSVTSKLQTSEAISFIDEAILYVNNNNDSSCFVVLVDGYAGEMHLEDMRESVETHSRIYAGNCEQVIEWLNSQAK